MEKQVISQDNLIRSKKDIAEDMMKKLSISAKYRTKIHKMLGEIIVEDYDEEKIEKVICKLYEIIKNVKL